MNYSHNLLSLKTKTSVHASASVSLKPNDFELTMCHLAPDLSGTVRSDCIAHNRLCLLLKYNLEAVKDLQMGQYRHINMDN